MRNGFVIHGVSNLCYRVGVTISVVNKKLCFAHGSQRQQFSAFMNNT